MCRDALDPLQYLRKAERPFFVLERRKEQMNVVRHNDDRMEFILFAVAN
jgi:hypothetical protein